MGASFAKPGQTMRYFTRPLPFEPTEAFQIEKIVNSVDPLNVKIAGQNR